MISSTESAQNWLLFTRFECLERTSLSPTSAGFGLCMKIFTNPWSTELYWAKLWPKSSILSHQLKFPHPMATNLPQIMLCVHSVLECWPATWWLLTHPSLNGKTEHQLLCHLFTSVSGALFSNKGSCASMKDSEVTVAKKVKNNTATNAFIVKDLQPANRIYNDVLIPALYRRETW